MTQLHVMIDLETWGTTPGSDIRSIGACMFDPSNGAVNLHDGEEHPSHFYIACDNPFIGTVILETWRGTNRVKVETVHEYKYPLTRDPKTVQWWGEQTTEAQSAFTDPVDLREALQRFGDWLWNIEGGETDCVCLWAHGPQFDVSILDAAYRAVNLPTPWHYRAPRDTRTAFDMANVGDHSTWMQQFNHGTAHNALDDAISQARAVCAAYGRLRLPHDIKTHRDAWRKCIVEASRHADSSEWDAGSYYDHELKAFDRTFEALDRYPNID